MYYIRSSDDGVISQKPLDLLGHLFDTALCLLVGQRPRSSFALSNCKVSSGHARRWAFIPLSPQGLRRVCGAMCVRGSLSPRRRLMARSGQKARRFRDGRRRPRCHGKRERAIMRIVGDWTFEQIRSPTKTQAMATQIQASAAQTQARASES